MGVLLPQRIHPATDNDKLVVLALPVIKCTLVGPESERQDRQEVERGGGPPSLPPYDAPSWRFIIIRIAAGEDIDVDYEGAFGWWEVKAALERALEMVEEEEFQEEMEEGPDEQPT